MILDWFLDPSEFHVLKSSLILDSAQRDPPPQNLYGTLGQQFFIQ